MKNITKRLLASIIAIGTLLSVVPAFAEETTATVDTVSLAETENAVLKAKYAEELALLSGLGILDDTENIKMTNSITRAEFLSLVMKTIKMDQTITESADVIFYDVLPSNNYYSAIMSAHKMGLIHGDDKGCFNPDSPIDAVSALKILVCALDYGFVAEAKGGYPNGYLDIARSLGLSDRITVSGNVDWRMAIIMIDNALHSYVSEKSYTYDGSVGVGPGSDTILEKYYGLVRYTGTVEETNYTLRMKGDEYEETALQISGKIYTNIELSPDECKDLLGKVVIYYLDEETDTIYAISEDPKYNNVTVIEPDDIKSASLTQIRYWNENNKETKIGIDDEAKFYYNGARSFAITTADLKPEEGKITLIDTTNDKIADVVIIEDWYSFPVAKCSSTRLVSLYADGKDVDLNNTDLVFYKNGFEVNSFYVNAYEVARIMLSKDGKAGIAEISGWELTATVENIREKDGKHYMTLDGTEYRVAQSFVDAYTRGDVDAPTPKKKSRYQFILDDDNVVFGIKRTTLDEFQYGYMVKVAKGSGLDAACQVKIYGSQGAMLKLDVPENIKVNGKKPADFFAKVAPTGTYEPQLIMYKLNSNNELVEIKLATDTRGNAEHYDLDNFSLDMDNNGNSNWAVNGTAHTILGQQVMNDGVTPMFYIPYDLEDEEDYRWVVAYGSETSFSRPGTTIKLYDLVPYDERYPDYNRVGAVVLRQTKANYDSQGPIGGYAIGSFSTTGLSSWHNIVNEVREEADEEGNINLVLEYYTLGGTLSTAYCREDAINNTAESDIYHDVKITDLKYGDLIVMSYDYPSRNNPLIDRFQVYARAEDYGDLENFELPFTWTSGSSTAIYTHAEILYVDESMFLIRAEDANGTNQYSSCIKSGTVWDYSVSRDEIMISNISNIAAGDKIYTKVVFQDYRAPEFIIRVVE